MNRALCWTILVALACLPSMGQVTLVLQDGREISGRSVERKESLYLLQQDDDAVLAVPEALVVEVIRERPAPTGIKLAEAQTLVGPPGGVKLPTREEQLAVLEGSRSIFRPGVIDPTWTPRSGLGEDVTEFNPARWYVGPIDPTWTPRSGLGEDVTEFNPARWYVPPIDPTWWPEDGLFRRD